MFKDELQNDPLSATLWFLSGGNDSVCKNLMDQVDAILLEELAAVEGGAVRECVDDYREDLVRDIDIVSGWHHYYYKGERLLSTGPLSLETGDFNETGVDVKIDLPIIRRGDPKYDEIFGKAG